MTTTHLKQFLQQPYPGKAAFLRHVLEPLFGAENVHDTFDEPLLDRHPHLLSMARTTGIRAITRMAHVDLGVEPLDIFDVAVSDRVCMSRNRVGVQQLVRRIMDTYTGAFLLIHYEDRPEWEWRFTFCHKTHDAASGTSARRFTFLLGPGQACRTAAENFGQLIDRRTDDPDAELYIDDLRQAFSVEALSREFFARYKAHYQAFVDFMVSDAPMRQDFTGTPQPADTPEARHREEKPIRDYVKKLLGRIVFLHFLQKKRWLGVPLGAPWGEGPADFLHRLFHAADADQQADFLDGTLEPLFDRGLDTDRRAEGDAYDTGIAAIGTVRIPWLSGGLFERDRLDRLPSRFPPQLFRDLFEMLAEYNFTVDENDPDDAEVGVDPEMLGRIFENLLENNNDTGAFYTPKEVVRYMCRESLLAHLVATLPGVDAHTLRALVESHNVEQLPAPLAEKIDRALADVKICDPAIGSGAFPMGLLRLLFACRTALTPLLESQRTAADLKRHIIRHNIYGVDIERGAVDIARLRFWLALVVDAPEPLPLPHLDYKIMQGDSLLERIADVDLSHIAEAGAVAPPVQQDLFGAVDLDAARVGFATAEACATFRRELVALPAVGASPSHPRRSRRRLCPPHPAAAQGGRAPRSLCGPPRAPRDLHCHPRRAPAHRMLPLAHVVPRRLRTRRPSRLRHRHRQPALHPAPGQQQPACHALCRGRLRHAQQAGRHLLALLRTLAPTPRAGRAPLSHHVQQVDARRLWCRDASLPCGGRHRRAATAGLRGHETLRECHGRCQHSPRRRLAQPPRHAGAHRHARAASVSHGFRRFPAARGLHGLPRRRELGGAFAHRSLHQTKDRSRRHTAARVGHLDQLWN